MFVNSAAGPLGCIARRSANAGVPLAHLIRGPLFRRSRLLVIIGGPLTRPSRLTLHTCGPTTRRPRLVIIYGGLLTRRSPNALQRLYENGLCCKGGNAILKVSADVSGTAWKFNEFAEGS